MQDLEIPIWKEAPFIRIVVPLMAGILMQWYVPWPFVLSLSATGISLLFCLMFARLSLMQKYKWRFWLGINFTLLYFFIGQLLLAKADDRFHSQWYGHIKNVSAWEVAVADPPEAKQNSFQLVAEVKAVFVGHRRLPAKGRLLLSLKKETERCPLQYGDVFLFCKQPRSIVNSGNPGAFDNKRYQAFRHIYKQVYINASQLQLLPQKEKASWKIMVLASQRKTLAVLRRYLSDDVAVLGIAEALLIGYKSDLDKSLVQSYSNTGVVHIIAISGLHLGLICMVLVWLFDQIPGFNKMTWTKAILVIVCLWLFSLMTGASASVLRSAVMFTVILLGRCMQRETAIYNSLAASAFLLLVYNPYLLWDVGFQLSYLAIIGIVMLQKPLQQMLEVNNWLLNKIWEMSAITLAAQIVATPICLFYFHQFPSYFLLSNLLAVPLSTVVLFAELLLLLVAPFPMPAHIVAAFTRASIHLLNGLIQYIGQWPHAIIDNIVADTFSTCLMYLTLAALLLLLLKKKRVMMWPTVLLFSCWLFYIQYKKFVYQHQQQLLFLNIPHHSAFIYAAGTQAFFSGDTELIRKPDAFRFYIRPVMQTWGLRQPIRCNAIPSNGTFLFRVANKKLMVIDKDFNPMAFDSSWQPDIILIRHHPSLHFNDWVKKCHNPILIFDDANPLWKIEQWKKECDVLHLRSISIPEAGARIFTFL